MIETLFFTLILFGTWMPCYLSRKQVVWYGGPDRMLLNSLVNRQVQHLELAMFQSAPTHWSGCSSSETHLRRGSVVKNMYRDRGPKWSFQHPCQVTYNHLECSTREPGALYYPPRTSALMCTYPERHTTLQIKSKRKLFVLECVYLETYRQAQWPIYNLIHWQVMAVICSW